MVWCLVKRVLARKLPYGDENCRVKCDLSDEVFWCSRGDLVQTILDLGCDNDIQ